MKTQTNLEYLVEDILRKNEESRNDDFILIAEVIYRLNPSYVDLSIKYLFLGHKQFNIPPFESITRARRKVQATNKDLCSKRTIEKRKQIEKLYKNYFTERNV